MRIPAQIVALTFLTVLSAAFVPTILSAPPASVSGAASALAGPSSTAPISSDVARPLVDPSGPISVPVGAGPNAVLVDTANDTIVVSNQYNDNVSLISLNSDAPIASVPVGSEPAPQGLALDLANATVYVVTAGSDNVSAIFLPIDGVSASISVGASPNAILYDSANREVYVANGGSGDVSVISTVTNSVVGTIPVGSNPDALALDTTNHELFVANAGSNTVSIISGTSNLVLATEFVGQSPGAFGAMAFDPTNGEIYVANIGSSNVSVIGGQNHTVFGAIPVGSGPSAIAVDPTKGEVFVVNSGSGNVSVLSTTAVAVNTSIPVGSEPSSTGGVAFNPVEGDILVPNAGSRNISVISVSTKTVVDSVPVLATPDSIGVDTLTGTGYVADGGAANLSAFTLGPVTFDAVGLPPGTSWSISVGSPATLWHNTTVGTIGRVPLLELVGTLPYTISPPASYGVTSVTGLRFPTQTSANLTTAASTFVIRFGRLESLTFTETGLPASTLWGVTITSAIAHGGAPRQTMTSTTSTIVFSAVEGSWKYAVTTKPAIFSATPSHSIVAVGASAVGRTIRFARLTAEVLFEENGLASGTRWQVNVTGPMNLNESSTGATIRFALENGTYTYVAENYTGVHPHLAHGTFTVVAPHAPQIIHIIYNTGAAPAQFGPGAASAGPMSPGRTRE